MSGQAVVPYKSTDSQNIIWPWYKVWLRVLTRPGIESFRIITSEQSARFSRAVTWICIAASLDFISSTVVLAVTIPAKMNNWIQIGDSGSFPLLSLVCGFPFYAVAYLAAYLGMIGIFHGLALLAGGSGTFEKMVFASASLAAPFSLGTACLLPFATIPYISYLFIFLVLLCAVYLAGLQIMAIMAIHRVSFLGSIFTLAVPMTTILMSVVGIFIFVRII